MTLEELQHEYEQQKAQILCLKKTIEHLIKSFTSIVGGIENMDQDIHNCCLKRDVDRSGN